MLFLLHNECTCTQVLSEEEEASLEAAQAKKERKEQLLEAKKEKEQAQIDSTFKPKAGKKMAWQEARLVFSFSIDQPVFRTLNNRFRAKCFLLQKMSASEDSDDDASGDAYAAARAKRAAQKVRRF